MKRWLAAVGLVFFAVSSDGVEIVIDYTYDTSNFFDTAQKRAAMEAVADFYGGILQDELLSIDASEFSSASWSALIRHPATGEQVEIADLVVPKDTLVVYVGARDLPGSAVGRAAPGGFSASGFLPWFERIRGRGSAGASASPASARTDFSPWGGYLAFDSLTSFQFSTTGNELGVDFLSVALHEMGHVLGLGSADSWHNLVSAGTFTGVAAGRSYGSAPPLQVGAGHWADFPVVSSYVYGSFGNAHGVSQAGLMSPSIVDNNVSLFVASDLDLAALADIGWEVEPPLAAPFLSLAQNPLRAHLTWPSQSFFSYEVERGLALTDFAPLALEQAGTGQVLAVEDEAAPRPRAFYRISRTSLAAGGLASSAEARGTPAGKRPQQAPETITELPPQEPVCRCDHHGP